MGVVEKAVRKQHEFGSVDFWIDTELSRAGSVTKAAQAIGVSPRSLYRWIVANGYTLRPYRTVWLSKDEHRPSAI